MALSQLLANPNLADLMRNLNPQADNVSVVGTAERKSEEGACGHSKKLLVGGVCSAEIGAVTVTLPCKHEATTTKCGESTNPSLIMCRVRCVSKARGCGHEVRTRCHSKELLKQALAPLHQVRTRCHSKDLLKQALAPLHQCQMLLHCGHRCSSSWCCKNKAYAVAIGKGIPEDHALKQAAAVEHPNCTHMCDKRMPCGHKCERGCHYGRPCKCFARGCSHAACSAAPCQGDCDWQCPHLAADEECTMPCGLPCVRPPCDMQCEKVLPCGHRCPSLCGEPCPGVHHCPKCTGEEGIITGEIPLWLPCCGARVQLVELDDVFNMTTYYEQIPDRHRDGHSRLAVREVWSRFGSPEPLPYGHRPHIPECKLCGKPIRLINRYRRITALGSLHGAIEQTLPAYNGCLKMLEDAYAHLIKIESSIGLCSKESGDDRGDPGGGADGTAGGSDLVDSSAGWPAGSTGSDLEAPSSRADMPSHSRETYAPARDLAVSDDELRADALYSLLTRMTSGLGALTSAQLLRLRSMLVAVYTALSFAASSLQRSLPEGTTASLGLPRFDSTLQIQAYTLYLRLCVPITSACGDDLNAAELVTLSSVAVQAVHSIKRVAREAGIKQDLRCHATSAVSIAACCAARAIKLLTAHGDKPGTRAALVDILNDGIQLLEGCAGDGSCDSLDIAQKVVLRLGGTVTDRSSSSAAPVDVGLGAGVAPGRGAGVPGGAVNFKARKDKPG